MLYFVHLFWARVYKNRLMTILSWWNEARKTLRCEVEKLKTETNGAKWLKYIARCGYKSSNEIKRTK